VRSFLLRLIFSYGILTDCCFWLGDTSADAADKRGFLITPEDELRELMGKVRLDARVRLLKQSEAIC
jgi:hypothetical protein